MTETRSDLDSSAAPLGRAKPSFWRAAVAIMLVGFCMGAARAGEPAEVQRGLLAGNYAAVIKQAKAELADTPANSEWSILLVQALLTVGRNGEADKAMQEALVRDPRSIRLRWLARDVAYANGRPEGCELGLDFQLQRRSRQTAQVRTRHQDAQCRKVRP